MSIKSKVNKIREEKSQLEKKMADPQVISQQQKYKEYSIRFNEISEIIECYDKYQQVANEYNETVKAKAEEKDDEMITLYEEEIKSLKKQKDKLLEKVKYLLIPKDKNDKKNAIMEIRAGTGGDEATLFAADLFRMYRYFIESKGWNYEIMNSNNTGVGGLKEISFEIKGKDAYGTLKYESGVHRVQRVPKTESSGRIHTSATSVVVLPEAEAVDLEIDPNDIKIDVYRSSGPGGQSVNTTDSAVRITHIPTDTIVTCQDEKSQHKNKKKAMKVLRSRLLDKKIQEQRKTRERKRKSMVGSGDRSAKIRTYNFPQSRVTDHRINYTTHNLEEFLNGDIEEVIDKLHLEVQKEFLEK